MYYQGMSVRYIETNFKMVSIDVDYSSVYDWIAKYSKMVSGCGESPDTSLTARTNGTLIQNVSLYKGNSI